MNQNEVVQLFFLPPDRQDDAGARSGPAEFASPLLGGLVWGLWVVDPARQGFVFRPIGGRRRFSHPEVRLFIDQTITCSS
jgi:hypothetical protein